METLDEAPSRHAAARVVPGGLRRRSGRRAVRVGAGVAVVLGLLYASAWLLTPYSGIARAIAWLEADTGDIDRFPARAVAAGDTPHVLTEGTAPSGVTVSQDGDAVPLEQVLADTGTDAFLVARGGRIVDERYLGGQTAESLHTSFSVAKSYLSAVLGAAVDRGVVRLDDPITDHLPELARRDARFAAITIRDLTTMTSGIAYAERSLPWSDDALTYYAADLRRLALTHTSIAGPPGEWHYNNYNPLLVSLILERATGRSISDLLEEWVWQPAGMGADGSWSLDSTRSGFEKSESGVNAVPRDYLRFGMLYRDGGVVDGRRVLSAQWVEASVTPQARTPVDGAGYGLFWWVSKDGRSFYAHGNHGQFIFVYPQHDLVIVRLGARYGRDDWPAIAGQLAAQYAGA